MNILNPLVRNEVLEERAYQLRIAEEAVKKNTLVVLPTALGKTVISALAAAYFLYHYSNYKILVLAPTRPLALQHRDTFLRLLRVKPDDTRVLIGKYPPEYRLYLWSQPYKIYFATPQTVENDLDNGLDLSMFSLIVFDECHRARGRYSYVKIAREYMGKSRYPMILGLTASPGSDEKKILEICENLFIEHIEVRDENDPDVKPYVKPIKADQIYVDLPESYKKASGYLKNMLMQRLRLLHSMGLVRKDPEYVYKSDLIEAGDNIRYKIEATMLDEELGGLYHRLSTVSEALILYHAVELLESQGAYTLLKFLSRIEEDMKKSSRRIVSTPLYNMIKNYVENVEEHPKMDKLLQTVLKQILESPESRIIIFTQYRDTASYITMRLKDLGLKAERFVGQASRYEDRGLKQDEQSMIIKKFREGDIKILVATSIAEEGLDIPSVDLVVFYEPVPSEIRYIQRRGRTGRAGPGKMMMLAAYDTLDTAYLRSSGKKTLRMKRMIRMMNKMLRPKLNRGAPLPVNVMSDEEIREAGEYVLPKPLIKLSEDVEEELQLIDETSVKIFNRDVRHASRELLNHILENGSKGIGIDELVDGYKDEYPEGIVKAALKRLEDEKQIETIGKTVYPRGASYKNKKMGYGEIHIVEVEKIFRGEAIVVIDDKWRAVLYPADYNGPRYLLKRGKRFKALSKLYKLNRKLHIRIYNILELEEL